MIEYTGSAAASAVIMSHVLRNKKIIFVEGVHDGNLLETLFEGEVTAISAKGCNGVIEAVDAINEHNKKSPQKVSMIGFIDTDYLHIKDEEGILKREEIVSTTYRDIEIDLIHTRAMKRLLEEKASSHKWDCELKVAQELLNTLKEVSFLRAYNFAKERNWDFKWINIAKYSNSSGDFDNSKIISAFRQKNKVKDSEWGKYIKWKNETDMCLKMITRGHDATCLLGIMLRKKLGNRKKEETEHVVIEENLRLAVEKKFIEAYQWFQQIFEWAYNKSIQATGRGAAALTR